MCAMPHSAATLAGMTSDPRTGVVAQHRSVHIVIEKDKISVMKEALIKKLNTNVNKFYPDAGGIMMGYQGIKMKRSTCEVNSLPLLHPVHIRAQFYLFRPQVGSEVTCVVTSREEGRVKCLVHSVFEVEVLSPPGCWDTVLVGQTVVVKVEAVEQMAWQEPKIIATLLDTRDNVAPLIDIVENLEVEEFESVTDSGMFEYEQNSVTSSGVSGGGGGGMRGDRSAQEGCEEIEVMMDNETRGNTSNNQSHHHAAVEASKDDGVSEAASMKRKIQDTNSSSVRESDSPVMKRTRRRSSSSSSSDSDSSTDQQFPVTSTTQDPSAKPPPSSAKSKNSVSSPATSKPSPSPAKLKNMPSPVGSSPAMSKPSPSPVKSKNLPSPTNSTSVRESNTPVKKRTRKRSNSSSFATGTSPTPQSSDSNNEQQFPVPSTQDTSAMPPPSPAKSKNSVFSSPAMSKPSSSSVKSKNFPSPATTMSKPSSLKKSDKILPKILPRFVIPSSKSGDDSDSRSDDEDSNAEQISKPDKPTVAGIAQTIQDNSTAINATVVPNLLAFEPLLPPTPEKLPEANVAPKTPKSIKGRLLIPPGFKCEPKLNKNGKPKLTAPDGSSFRTYKAAWEWADAHPNYLVKSEQFEPQLALLSLGSPSMSGRSSPDMFKSQPEPLETAPCENEEEASGKAAEVYEKNPKQTKQHENDVPIPIGKACQGKLLVDQPSFSESEPEPPQLQNFLVPESDTEFQSQSLLPPPNIVMKKADKTGKNATIVSVTKSPLNLQSEKAIIDGTSKSPGKPTTDDVFDSDAESSFEGTKPIAALTPSKLFIKQSPSRNVDFARTSSNSSSEDSSSDEEPPTQIKSVAENVPAKKSVVPTSDDDSSSYVSETSDNNTVTAPKDAIRLRKNEKVVSSSDSDSDSSDESDLEVDKFHHQVTVIVTDPVKTAPTSIQSTEIVEKIPETIKEVFEPVKKVDNKTSSSSDSVMDSPQRQKKLTKKKNSPKLPKKHSPKPPVKNSPESKTTLNTSDEKSPHLSSTVVTGTDRLKDKLLAPDGISPILKTRHKPKSGGEKSGISYFDQVMATSKMGSHKSNTKPVESDSNVSDKNAKKKKKQLAKKKKQVAGFM
eukprot:GFUD01017437.1.p1 GENE.GFUD01017437.1~~GFUD01017437.1.p1  ORF type:complete len:1111 (-),score=302.78 GFUD01017437.1:41-3373(-)